MDYSNREREEAIELEFNSHSNSSTFADAIRLRDDFKVSRVEIGTRLAVKADQKLTSPKWVRRALKAQSDSGADRSNYARLLAAIKRESLFSHGHNPYYYYPISIGRNIKSERAWHSLTLPGHGLPDFDSESTRTIFYGNQAALPLVGNFSPSRALVEFWTRGVASNQPRLVARPPISTGEFSPQLQAEFAKLLSAILSTQAQQRRYSKLRVETLSRGGRFSTQVQLELCDQFQIIPDEGGAFLSALHSELSAALHDGARIEGAWGWIYLNETRDLVYHLSEAYFVEDPSFTASEDVE